MANADTDLQCRNRILLWDLYRETRYAKRRAGWFDCMIRTSSLLTSICATAAFASFAGDWPTLGMVAAAAASLFALICKHFDYPTVLADYQASLAAHQGLLAQVEDAGGVDMDESARRRFAAEYARIGQKLAPRFVAERPLLMCICENEVAECDFDAPLQPSTEIPWWGHLVCQIWPWRWPASVIVCPSEAEAPSAAPEASAEADAAPAEAAHPGSSSRDSAPHPDSAAPR